MIALSLHGVRYTPIGVLQPLFDTTVRQLRISNKAAALVTILRSFLAGLLREMSSVASPKGCVS